MDLPVTYRESQALNQSKLKRILDHPKLFINEDISSDFDEPKDHIDIGDAVDLILTGSEREFHETFIVSTVPRPTGNMGEFCWAKFKYRDFENADELAYSEVGIKLPKTVEAYMEKFEKEGRAYYEQLLGAVDKRLISQDKYDTICRIVEAVKQNPEVYKYINPNGQYEVHFQVELKFEIEGVLCKGLCDAICIDKETRVAFIVDVKTTRYSVSSFPIAFFNHRYDFQAAWYWRGLHKDIKTKTELNISEIISFVFVVGSSKFPDQSLSYSMGPNMIRYAVDGYENNGKVYEGINKAIERYKFHKETDQWDYKMEEYQNNFCMKLKING